jgi:hypothetical protein
VRNPGINSILLAACVLLLSTVAVLAHDKWWNGKEVDPSTKRYCCGDHDIKHLEPNQVRVVPGGYKLEDTGEVIPEDRTQPSPDGEYWVFRWGIDNQTQCFFAPLMGT